MRQNGVGRLWLPALAVAVVLTVWLRTTGTEAAFAVTTGNPGNTFSAYPDWKPPIISQATVLKSQGGIPGYVRTTGTYTVLANVVDDPSSNPPATIASVVGNVGTLTTGATAVAMTAGAQTVGGVSYTHTSASQTVTAGGSPSAGSLTITSSDRATPANTSAAFPFSVVVDNTPPSPSLVTTTNAGGPTGAGVGQPGVGDTITYKWNEPIDPSSIVSGWDGSGSQTVTVQIANKNGNTGDQVTIWNGPNNVQLPLGLIALGNKGYVTTSIYFGGPTNTSGRSTMTWNATTGAITVTLGPPDGTATPGTVSTPSAMTWTPQSAAFDRAGNPSSTSMWTESPNSVKF